MAKARFQITEKASLSSDSAGKLTITIITPGMSKNRNYYSASVLKESATMFSGARMMADHAAAGATDSVDRWVGTVGTAYAEKDGTIKADATLIDDAFKKKLDKLKEAGQLSKMGISIRIVAEASTEERDGVQCRVCEKVVEVSSVDFVTYAAAGGLKRWRAFLSRAVSLKS